MTQVEVEWLAAHEGHDVDTQLTVAHCATCDSYLTLTHARPYGGYGR